jgi:hypothetical protein
LWGDAVLSGRSHITPSRQLRRSANFSPLSQPCGRITTTSESVHGNGGKESREALAAGGGEAKRAFEAMMPMKKIDIATIEAARRG